MLHFVVTGLILLSKPIHLGSTTTVVLIYIGMFQSFCCCSVISLFTKQDWCLKENILSTHKVDVVDFFTDDVVESVI